VLRTIGGVPTSPIHLKAPIELRSYRPQAIAPVLFELITKDLGAAITITDVDDRTVWVNQSFERLTGFALELMRGQKPGDLLQGPETDPATVRHMSERLARREGFAVEVLNYRPDGRAYWVSLTTRPLINPDGSVAGYIGTQYNVSERRAAESALAEREALLRSVGDNLPDGYVYQLVRADDGNIRYRYVSRGAEPLLGVSVEAIIGGQFDPFAVIHPDDRERVHALSAECARTMSPFDYQGRRILPSGEVRWAHHRSAPSRDADGQVVWNGVLLDITERKRAEAGLDSSLRQLEAQNAELTEFTYTVSHDLRSPLVTIRGFSGLARTALKRGETEQAIEHLDRIDRASARMVELLNDLLDLTRIGRVVESGERAPLNTLIDDVLNMLHAEIQRSGAVIDVQPDLPHVFGDLSRIKQVLANLIANAIKFNRPGVAPHINIGGERDGRHSVFYVADQGRGIPQQFQSKLFGLFQRLHADVEGTGIGLALVKRIAELHGGSVTLHSAGENQGARFTVKLPL
jgi:PAS domain S-box-containing protein